MLKGDGSYQTSNFPAVGKLNITERPGMYKGMVMRVYPIDDNGNPSKGVGNQEVVYDLIVLGGARAGEQVTNARDICFLGGVSNYSERTWRACSNPNFQRESGTDIGKQDGDVVIFTFLNDNPLYPMILGGATHYQNNGLTGATSMELPRLLFEYNGINILIDNQGQLFVTHKGGVADTSRGGFTPNKAFESVIQMSEQQVIIKDNVGNIITVDAASKSIIISAPSAFNVSSDTMALLAKSSYSLTTKVVTIQATTSIDIKTPTTTLESDQVTVEGQSGGDAQVSLNGSTFKVVSTNSYDPFLAGPHIDGYTKVTTKG